MMQSYSPAIARSYGELHAQWLAATPSQPCSNCGQPMTVETLTEQLCKPCGRWLVTNIFCRHCGAEMDGDGGAWDPDARADAHVFTCPGCHMEVFTYDDEAVGHIVMDEEEPQS